MDQKNIGDDSKALRNLNQGSREDEYSIFTNPNYYNEGLDGNNMYLLGSMLPHINNYSNVVSQENKDYLNPIGGSYLATPESPSDSIY
jgi:hypothetical protein